MSTTLAKWFDDPRYASRHGDRQIARDANGTIWHCWSKKESGGTYSIYVTVTPLGYAGQFVELARGSEVNEIAGMAICIDIDNQPVICYRVKTVSTIYVRRRISAVWTAEATQATHQTGGNGISIACDPSGDFWLLYVNYRASSGAQSVIAKKSTNDLGTWSASGTLYSATTSTDEATDDGRVSMVVDQNGDVHTAYVARSTASRLLFEYVRNNGSWGSSETIQSVQQANDALAPKELSLAVGHITVGGVATPGVAWITDGRLHYMKRGASSWSNPIRTPLGLGIQRQPSLTYQADGRARIYWVGTVAFGQAVEELYVSEEESVDSASWITTPLTSGSTYNVVAPFAVHQLSPTPDGAAYSGFFVGFADLDAGGVKGDGYSLREDGTIWQLRHAGGVALSLSAMGVNAGTTASHSVGVPLSLIGFKPVHTKEHREDLVLALTLSATAERRDVTVPLTMSVSASEVGDIQDSGSVPFSMSAVAFIEQTVLCETDFVPDENVNADIDGTLITTFSGPFAAPTRTLNMLRPTYGSMRDVDERVVTHRTRGGDVVSFKSGVRTRRLPLRWVGMSRKKAIEVEDFFEAMSGRTFRFQDWEGNLWRAALVSRSVPISTEHRDVGHSVSLELDVESL